jgi:hypothetical protein
MPEAITVELWGIILRQSITPYQVSRFDNHQQIEAYDLGLTLVFNLVYFSKSIGNDTTVLDPIKHHSVGFSKSPLCGA